MLFVYLDHKNAVLNLGEKTCQKHVSSQTSWGLDGIFIFKLIRRKICH
jgi:hypothetical protein